MLNTPSQHHPIHLLGFPMDLGAGRRGVDMGPSALRIAGIASKLVSLGYDVRDRGNVYIETSEVHEAGNPRLKYLDAIVPALTLFAETTYGICRSGGRPLLMGGDHSMAIGSLAGLSKYASEEGKRLGVIWIDAHSDINTDATTPSGNIHGMPLAASLGLGSPALTHILGFSPKISPEHLALIGIRSVDSQERETIKQHHIPTYTMADVDKRGVPTIIAEVLERMSKSVDLLHVSFDLDSVDPSEAPGVGTPVPGGFTYREAHYLMESIAQSGLLHSLEITEVNPILDVRNSSAELAVALVGSCFGERIL